MRLLTILFASSALLWFGCPAEDHSWSDDDGDSASGDDDTATPDDDVSDDDAGDDDAGDDDTGIDPGDQTDGMVSMTYVAAAGGPSHILFSASFMEIITPATSGVSLEIPTGEDQCTVVLYDYEDLYGGDPGEFTYEAAGTISLTGNGLSYEVEAQFDAGAITYTQDIPFNQFTFGASYDVSVPGDEFPGFSATLVMPSLMELTEPAGASFQLLDGDFEVVWSGGDGSDASLMVSTLAQDFQSGGIVYCLPSNDGSFAVPGNLVNQLPAGTASMVLQQYTWDLFDVSGRPVYALAGSGVMATGNRP